MKRYASYAIDFEYKDFGSAYQLVCCSINPKGGSAENYWLFDGSDTGRLKARLNAIQTEDHMLVAHAVERAEARCLIMLEIDPRGFKWFDTYLAAKCLTNSNQALPKQKKKMPDGEELEESNESFFGRELSLLACLKRFGIAHEVSAEEKTDYRNTIINGSDAAIGAAKDKIMAYCATDVADLHMLASAEYKTYVKRYDSAIRLWDGAELYDEGPMAHVLGWGHTAAIYAVIWARGIPVWKRHAEAMLGNGPRVREGLIEQLDAKYPGIAFRGGSKALKRSVSQSYVQDKIRALNVKEWPRTATGKYKADDKTLKNYENLDPFIADYREYLKTTRNFAAFAKGTLTPRFNPSRSTFHPDACCYGTQTGRCGAKPSTGFVPGFSKVLRTLVHPNEKSSLVGIDFSGEENCLMAGWSGDERFKAAYLSDDFYLYICSSFGLCPPYDPSTGSFKAYKARYKQTRNLVKPIVLGLGYGRGAEGIYGANKASFSSLAQVEKLVERYKKLFRTLYAKRAKMQQKVEFGTCDWVLPNGWLYRTFKPRKDKTRGILSALNFPIQGVGSAILYEALKRLETFNVKTRYTVHDEVVASCQRGLETECAATMKRCMLEAVRVCTGIDYLKVGEPEINDGAYVYHDGEHRFCQQWRRIMLLLYGNHKDRKQDVSKKLHCREQNPLDGRQGKC